MLRTSELKSEPVSESDSEYTREEGGGAAPCGGSGSGPSPKSESESVSEYKSETWSVRSESRLRQSGSRNKAQLQEALLQLSGDADAPHTHRTHTRWRE